jgi:hypothetical protein
MKKLLFLLTIIMSVNISAQFTKSVIASANVNGAYGILEKDLDDDGDMDLMAASQNDNTLSYYINDGTGIFTQHIITTNLTGAAFIDAADFGNDGDMDFVALGTSDLVWYEFDNGSYISHTVASGLNNPLQVRLYDIGSITDPGTPDGDTDIGLLVSGDNNATVYINDGTNTFSRMNIISINTPKYLHGGDFNSDNTDDLIVTSYSDNNIEWYRLGTFGFVSGGIVVNNFHGAFGVEGGDIDLDGDDDVIATAFLDNEVAWFENTDGTGTNFTKHTIDNNLIGASYIHWVDIDGDSDKDIIVTAYGNGTSGAEIAIYYNDGAQNFTKTTIDNLENGYETFSVQDFDGNGTFDIAFAANLSNKLVLLSQTATSISNNVNALFKVYPNPTDSHLNISAEKAIKQVVIFDISGRKLIESAQSEINISYLPAGNYLLQVQLINGTMATQKFIVKH